MDEDEKRKKSTEFIAKTMGEYSMKESDTPLSRALYTFNELGLFGMDDVSIGTEEAVRIWALVETIRRRGAFPDELRM